MPTSRSAERLFAALPWLAAALPFIVVLIRGVPAGEDLQLEVARVAAYAHAWSDGQRPPFWAPDLYAGFGSPIFLFYGQVCVALSSLFALVSGSFSTGFVLCLASASALGVFGMRRAAAALPVAQNASSTRVAVFMLVLNPYLVGDALLRNAGAEYIALCAMPLVVYGLLLCARSGSRGPLWLATGTGLVFATHNLSALVACGLCLVLASSLAFGSGVRGRITRVALGLGAGLALAAYAWLPAFALKAWIQSDSLTLGKFDFHRQFPALSTLFDARTFFSPGPMPLLAALAAARCWWMRSAERALLAALLFMFCAFWFVQLPASTPLWEHIPLLPLFSFPWRFMGPLALTGALLASWAFAVASEQWSPEQRLRREAWVLAACVVCLLPQFARMRVYSSEETQRFEATLTRAAMRRLPISTTAAHEYLPAGASLRGLSGPADDAPIVTASDGFHIAIRKREPSSLAFDVKSDAGGVVCLARFRFPLWRVTVDAQEQPSVACGVGFLGIQVPPGRHQLAAQIEVPRLRQLGLWLSALAFLTLTGFAIASTQQRRS